MRNVGRRGFTLLEMVVALAIVATLLAVGLPLFAHAKRRNDLNDATRTALSNIRSARSLGSTGRVVTTPPPTIICPNCSIHVAPPMTAHFGGIRIVSTTQYAVFIDDNN